MNSIADVTGICLETLEFPRGALRDPLHQSYCRSLRTWRPWLHTLHYTRTTRRRKPWTVSLGSCCEIVLLSCQPESWAHYFTARVVHGLLRGGDMNSITVAPAQSCRCLMGFRVGVIHSGRVINSGHLAESGSKSRIYEFILSIRNKSL